MIKPKSHDFDCPVVHERVRVELRSRRSIGLRNVEGFFVHCNQQDCQYAAENRPPCPLQPSMFADEIAEIEERRRAKRERPI